MKLDALKFGLACAIIWSASVLLMGLLTGYIAWGGGLVKALGTLYLGYKTGLSGAIIGTVWAFCDAGIGGFVLAWLYNALVGKK